jgi:mannose-6-phosphate isomerase-like protein (cupin superfamily)
MIGKLHISEASALPELGMVCQRLLPGIDGTGEPREPSFGVMACFLPSGKQSDPDCHDQVEVMVVLSGSGAVDIAGEETTVDVGEMVAIQRNCEHVVRNSGGATMSWLSFYWPLHEPVREASA